MPDSGPRSGKNAPKKTSSKKGKAKMSQAAWDNLSPKQREVDYGGSRFETAGGSRNSAKEAGHRESRGGPAAGRGRSAQSGPR